MKRVLALIFAVALLLSMTCVMAGSVTFSLKVSAETYTCGDCNQDGSVNMKDVLLIRKYMAGIVTDLNIKVSDTNADNAVNMKDVLNIRKYMAKMITLGTVDIGDDSSSTSSTIPTTSTTSTSQTTLPTRAPDGDTIDPVNPRINFLNGSNHTLGVWWWQPSLSEETLNTYMELCRDNQVTEIYYEGYAYLYHFADDQQKAKESRVKIHNFVTKAMQYGMRVAIMFDDKGDVFSETGSDQDDDGDGIGNIWEKVMEGYLAYKQEYPSDAVYGLHCDVEPGKANIQKYVTNFLEKEVRAAREAGIPVEVDLSCGWENQTGADSIKRDNGTTAPIYDIVAESVDGMILMSYRDTLDQIYSFGYAPLKAGSEKGTRVVFGVETMNAGEGDKVDFSLEDRYYMYSIMKKLIQKIDKKEWGCEVGLAIHQIEGWNNLRLTGGQKTI